MITSGASPSGGSENESLRILYCDPSKDSYETIRASLMSWFGEFIDVTWKADTKSALEEIDKGLCDILITEILFPDMKDPSEWIDIIVDHPGASDIPLVIYTECEDQMIPVYAFRAGISEFFPKKNANKYLMEYRLRNLFRIQFRTRMLYHEIDLALKRFQSSHGETQEEIRDLNSVIGEMRKELEREYASKLKLEEEKNKIQSVFGMYVDPAIVKGIMNNEISLDQKGQQQAISVLFADIRNYTTFSEAMKPELVIAFLNEFFTAMTEVILGNNGMIDKYMGDAIMCLFGAPISAPDHADNAVQTAIDMQNVFELWIPMWEKNYGFKPSLGIGVNTGLATLGNVGSFQKLSYTALGDTVNTAARVEAAAKGGQVLITHEMHGKLSPAILEKYAFQELEPIALKGKTGLHRVFQVADKVQF